jgi:hypothetical protein
MDLEKHHIPPPHGHFVDLELRDLHLARDGAGGRGQHKCCREQMAAAEKHSKG